MHSSHAMPVVKDLVLVGGGHAHALVLRMWGMAPVPGVRLTLISPEPTAPYSGMLPGVIAGHYRRDEIMIDLVRLARFAGARLILDRATGIDPAHRLIRLADRPAIAYDLASINVGITTDLPGVEGSHRHASAAKPLGPLAAEWEEFLRRDLPSPAITVIGGGLGGFELAMAAAHRLQRLSRRPRITLIDRSRPLAAIGARARARLLAEAAALGIEVLSAAAPRRITEGEVILEDGRTLASDLTLTVAGARPPAWLAESGLATTAGFLNVGPSLQTSDPAVFAAGDCAHLTQSPRPKAGVFAVRQAPVLDHNLRAALLEQGPLRRFRPQGDYLKLVSCGGPRAVADKFGQSLAGVWIWRWKDRIDRHFMAMFENLPPMPAPALPARPVPGLAEALGPKPLCGGCGSKLGAEVLGTALAGLPPPRRPDVLAGAGDDAAILLGEDSRLRLASTDHLRSFWADPVVMTRIAVNHALSDIWAMGGQPEHALAQIILPPLAPGKAAGDLAAILQTAGACLGEAGVDLVGGHSSSGAELTIGFTVLGTSPGPAAAKAGARPGDLWLLTKPIGSGIIMAAEMARTRLPGLILGEAVAEALAHMQRSNALAAAILAPRARAMTDVTGFGLAGHLLEMCQAAGLGAHLWAEAIPLMGAARPLAEAGQGSSLEPQNRAATLGRIRCADPVLLALLHDPQTSGGLLAALPPEDAAPALAALAAAGTPGWIIGQAQAGPPAIEITPRGPVRPAPQSP